MTEIYTVLDEDMAAELTQRFGDTVMEILGARGWETKCTSRFFIGRTYRVKQPSLMRVYDKIRSMNSFSNGGYGIPTSSVTEDPKRAVDPSVDEMLHILRPLNPKVGFITITARTGAAIAEMIEGLVND